MSVIVPYELYVAVRKLAVRGSQKSRCWVLPVLSVWLIPPCCSGVWYNDLSVGKSYDLGKDILKLLLCFIFFKKKKKYIEKNKT